MGAYESPEAAYWAFFETFNAKSASARAAVMSYPHLRVAATRSQPSDFSKPPRSSKPQPPGSSSNEPAGPGPNRSRRESFTAHRTRSISPAAGRDSAPTAQRSAETLLLYIATKMEQGWGIQGAFGVEGCLSDEAAQPAAEAALAALQREIDEPRSGPCRSLGGLLPLPRR